MNHKFKLGKKPAVKNSIPLRFRDYLTLAKLPTPPANGGHLNLVTEHEMFGNDQYGDCVCAGAAHETLLWNREAKRDLNINTGNVLEMYSDITGFNPNNPASDQGTSVPAAANWRKTVGLSDAGGLRHKVAAYVSITPGNIEEIKQAIYLFSVCGVGWELSQSALDQAERDEPWTIVNGSPIVGGHYTAAVGYDPIYLYIITWGQIVKVSWDFFSKYNDESIVYFTEEDLTNNKSLEGFNANQLREDINNL